MNRKTLPWLLVGGGSIAAGVAYWLASRKSDEVESILQDAIDAPPFTAASQIANPERGRFQARMTGYWPYAQLNAKQRLMEGGHNDRKSKPLITLEQHLRDPAKYPYVSVAGDYNIWPYGQRVRIDAWPTAVFRVVDTGGHFFGPKKVYRMAGYEPLDICVESPNTKVPSTSNAQIVSGDSFEKKPVGVAKMKDQNVIVGDVIGYADTDEDDGEEVSEQDIEALARALESELGGYSDEEMTAAAWAMKNRAAYTETSVKSMLAPLGEYGTPAMSGGFASTRREAGERAKQIASEVLRSPQECDPTDCAVDFWVPSQQKKMHGFGDVYRAAASSGDAIRVKKYEHYADYGDENEVRGKLMLSGLIPIGTVGAIELLGKV